MTYPKLDNYYLCRFSYVIKFSQLFQCYVIAMIRRVVSLGLRLFSGHSRQESLEVKAAQSELLILASSAQSVQTTTQCCSRLFVSGRTVVYRSHYKRPQFTPKIDFGGLNYRLQHLMLHLMLTGPAGLCWRLDRPCRTPSTCVAWQLQHCYHITCVTVKCCWFSLLVITHSGVWTASV